MWLSVSAGRPPQWRLLLGSVVAAGRERPECGERDERKLGGKDGGRRRRWWWTTRFLREGGGGALRQTSNK